MKYAFNSFTLEPNAPVSIRGSNSLYAFQNSSDNTVLVQGSNDAVAWFNLVTVEPNAVKTLQSAYKFLHCSGDSINVNRAATSSTGGGTGGGGLTESEVQELIDDTVSSLPTGGITFGGAWEVETTVAYSDAAFNQTEDATVVNNTFTPTALPGYAYARNILNSTPENGSTKQFKFTWPMLSPTDMFLVCFAASLDSEDISTLDFNQMFVNPNTHVLGVGYFATYASYFSLPNNQIILKKDGNSTPDVTNPSAFAQAGDDILMSLAGNALTITNSTQNTEMSLVFTSTNLEEQITLCIASSVAVEFSLDVQYPIQQALSTINIPENPIGKTYLVTSTDGSQIFGKGLKVDDFVTFFEDNGSVDVIISRLMTDAAITEIAANTINTVINTAGSNTQQYLEMFITALLAAESGDFYNQVVSTINSKINEQLLTGGTIGIAIQAAVNP